MKAANSLLAITVSALLATGCGPLVSLGDSGPASDLFTQSLDDVAAPDSPPPAFATIRIEEFEPGPELRTDRIAVRSSSVDVKYLTGARWIDRPAVLLQRGLVDAFSRWGGLTALGSTNLDVPADVRMAGRLQDYHLDVDGAPAVELTAQVLLLKTRGGGILASRRFAVRMPASGSEGPAVARAFNAAQVDLLRQIYSWAATVRP